MKSMDIHTVLPKVLKEPRTVLYVVLWIKIKYGVEVNREEVRNAIEREWNKGNIVQKGSGKFWWIGLGG